MIFGESHLADAYPCVAGSSQGRCSALGPRLRHVLLEERALPLGDLVVPAISGRRSLYRLPLYEAEIVAASPLP